jgi:hypothetical protein
LGTYDHVSALDCAVIAYSNPSYFRDIKNVEAPMDGVVRPDPEAASE